jgi:hypothetical protein
MKKSYTKGEEMKKEKKTETEIAFDKLLLKNEKIRKGARQAGKPRMYACYLEGIKKGKKGK